MASELRVDKIIPTTGVPTSGGGGIIQMVYATHDGSAHYTTTSGSWAILTSSGSPSPFELNITPKFSTSLIFVQYCGNGQQVNTQNTMSALSVFRTVTGGSAVNLGHDTCGLANIGDYSGSGSVYATGSMHFHVVDAPNTIESVNYKLYGKTQNGSGTAYPIHSQVRATLVAMEVSA